MDLRLVVWLYVKLAYGLVKGHHDGAPARACSDLNADHDVEYVFGPMPYIINVSSETYRCGESVKVNLTAISGSFRGFLCQARTIKNLYSTVGTLAAAGSVVMKQNCGPGKALTHSENSDKTMVQFTWTASEDHGNVLFVCTLVQDESTYYLRRLMANISFSGNCESTDSPLKTAKTTSLLTTKYVVTPTTTVISSDFGDTASATGSSPPTLQNIYTASSFNDTSLTTKSKDSPSEDTSHTFYFRNLSSTGAMANLTLTTAYVSTESSRGLKGFQKYAMGNCKSSGQEVTVREIITILAIFLAQILTMACVS